MALQFVSATALGTTDAGTDEIIVMFYGPRGGLRSSESVSLSQAKRLCCALERAIEALTATVANREAALAAAQSEE